ncbi:MAG: hypothetical protein ACYDCQ_20885 [Dehalococcoidia bacterium]
MLNEYELYGSVLQVELATRYASPEFQHRVTLANKNRTRVSKPKAAERTVSQYSPDPVF